MASCPQSSSQNCNFTCPNGGTWWVCAAPNYFVGCCSSDPCQNTGPTPCRADGLAAAEFNPSIYNDFVPNNCLNANSSFWYTCQKEPTFIGCCLVDPCTQTPGCPQSSLLQAAWAPSRPDQETLFLDGGIAGSMTSATAAASSTSATVSASSTSATVAASGTSSDNSSPSQTTTIAFPSATGLSKGDIVGIVVGAIAGLAIFVGLIALVMHQRGRLAERARGSAPGESVEEGSHSKYPPSTPVPIYSKWSSVHPNQSRS